MLGWAPAEASADGRSEHHGEHEKETEERDDEGQRLEIVGARISLLHATTPGNPTRSPCRIDDSLDGDRYQVVTSTDEVRVGCMTLDLRALEPAIAANRGHGERPSGRVRPRCRGL